MLRIEVEGDRIDVRVDGDEVRELIRDAIIAVATMVDLIRLQGGIEAAEAFLLYVSNMDKAGAFTIGGGEDDVPVRE